MCSREPYHSLDLLEAPKIHLKNDLHNNNKKKNTNGAQFSNAYSATKDTKLCRLTATAQKQSALN